MRHTLDVHIAWGDCDPAGIVFYPRYFAWFDQSSHALFTANGLDHRTVTEKHGAIGFSLVDARANFQSPGSYGEAVQVTSMVVKVGGSSLTVQHQIRRGETVLVEGQEIRVWIVREGDGVRAARIPDDVRAALSFTDQVARNAAARQPSPAATWPEEEEGPR